MIAEDAAEKVATPDQLARITTEGIRLIELTKQSETFAEQSKVAKQDAYKIATEVLPSLMDEAGIKMVGLADDFTLTREEQVFANVTKDNMSEACAWLEKSGHGSIIKNEFVIPVEKGDTKAMKLIRKLLKANKIPFEESMGVHPKTLEAFVKESVEEGRTLPAFIGSHIVPVVKLKAAKKKR